MMIARRDLQMEQLKNPTKDLLARIPHALQEKYSEPLSPMNGDVMVAALRNQKQGGGFKNAFLSLIDSSRAVASVSNGRQ